MMLSSTLRHVPPSRLIGVVRLAALILAAHQLSGVDDEAVAVQKPIESPFHSG